MKRLPSVRIFSKQTSTAESTCEVNAIRDSPVTSLGRPYSFPSVSRIYKLVNESVAINTSMLTRWPSPLFPLTVAVTTTRVSAPTKFLMQRGVTCPRGWANNSNLRACVNGRRGRSKARSRGWCIEKFVVYNEKLVFPRLCKNVTRDWRKISSHLPLFFSPQIEFLDKYFRAQSLTTFEIRERQRLTIWI